jgi:hypothetical protein
LEARAAGQLRGRALRAEAAGLAGRGALGRAGAVGALGAAARGLRQAAAAAVEAGGALDRRRRAGRAVVAGRAVGADHGLLLGDGAVQDASVKLVEALHFGVRKALVPDHHFHDLPEGPRCWALHGLVD